MIIEMLNYFLSARIIANFYFNDCNETRKNRIFKNFVPKYFISFHYFLY